MSEKNMIKTDLGDVKPVVEAGGKNSVYFLPNLNMSFFDDEFFININRKEKKITKDCAVTNNKTKLICGGDTDLFYVDEDGNFKWDIEFSEMPETNVFTWELKCSNDIEFIYQGALTEDEINDGCTRDEKIIGSYAVYCNIKNGKYKTGKICHIHKPVCIDAEGNTVYAELYIDNKELTITIPVTFLDNAIYPVTLDPTFGYTSAGASSQTLYYTSRAAGSTYNPHTAATGDTITKFYLYVSMPDSTTRISQVAAYSITSGLLDDMLETHSNMSITAASAAWYSVTVSQAMTNGVSYGIGFVPESDTINYYYDSGGSNQAHRNTAGGALTDPWVNYSNQSYLRSAYIEYSEGGGAVANNYYYLQNQ